MSSKFPRKLVSFVEKVDPHLQTCCIISGKASSPPTCLDCCHHPFVGGKSGSPEAELNPGEDDDCHNGHPTGHLVMMMACRHISTMTISHHGGEMSVMIKVGMCQ